MTGRDAGFATATPIHIDFKRVLLAGLRFRERKQVAIILRLRGQTVGVVQTGETFHRRERTLLRQQVINQRALIVVFWIRRALAHLRFKRSTSSTRLIANKTKNPILKNNSGLRSI